MVHGVIRQLRGMGPVAPVRQVGHRAGLGLDGVGRPLWIDIDELLELPIRDLAPVDQVCAQVKRTDRLLVRILIAAHAELAFRDHHHARGVPRPNHLPVFTSDVRRHPALGDQLSQCGALRPHDARETAARHQLQSA